MKILVYNPYTNKMETYYRELNENMPYSKDNFLTVKEFKSNSKTDLLWTDRRAIEAFNRLREIYGNPIPVGYAFKRISEGGHTGMSQHYAGVAFDVGQRLDNAQRAIIRNIARNYNLFTYVEPENLTPTWVHIDKRILPPACPTGGYPLVKIGSKGVYVAVLQDALNYLGYNAGTIDGIFGNITLNAVKRYQLDKSLKQDGIVGCITWKTLTDQIANKWKIKKYSLQA